VGSLTRPVRELRGFRRVHLKPGEKQRVEFTLHSADLGYYNKDDRKVIEPGEFYAWIAPDSSRGPRGEFRVTE
jgi:beta-glucosidase